MQRINKSVKVWAGLVMLFLLLACIGVQPPAVDSSSATVPVVTTRPAGTTMKPIITLSFTPTIHSTTLPPLPDFKDVLTFGGGGAGEWGCADSEYPLKANSFNALPGYGTSVWLCVQMRNIDPAKPLRITLQQSGGEGLTIESESLLLDKEADTVWWEGYGNQGVISKQNKDGSVFFTLVVWWPVVLPAGTWRVTLSHADGLRLSRDVQVSAVSGRAYINALDVRAREEVLPGGIWAGDHALRTDSIGAVAVAGSGYPPDSPVYILLYRENRLAQKVVVFSDGSGSVSAKLPGPFAADQDYIVYGIIDPNTILDDTSAVTCKDLLESVAGAACDYFHILSPASSSKPPPSNKSSSSCPGAPPQRMVVNQRGYVCTRSDSVRLRISPARSASTLLQLAPGTQFTIISGPACSDDWSWWNVRLNDGTTGWIAEGGDAVDAYFICPLP